MSPIKIILAGLFLTISWLNAVDATLTIKKDVEQRGKISLVDATTGASPVKSKFFDVLIADLKISGHFIPEENHRTEAGMSDTIDPELKNQEYVLKYALDMSGGMNATVKLLSAGDGRVILSKDYHITSADKYPFLAHQIAVDVNNKIGYTDIGWINRYILFTRYTGAKQSQVILADYTMSYQKAIIKGGLNLFAKWADKDQKSFYYTSYSGTLPTLYRLNIYSGSKSTIASSQGMIVCSDVSPAGDRILVTMAPNGQPDIYEMSAGGGSPRKITDFSDIDVSGKYLDGGASIAFVSNRGGKPTIYRQSIGGGSASVIARGSSNDVDTYNNQVVYSSRESSSSYGNNTFNLYLGGGDGGGVRPLTSSGTNQFPRFSVDGSIILYIKNKGGSSSIGYINLLSKENLLFPLGGKVQSIDW